MRPAVDPALSTSRMPMRMAKGVTMPSSSTEGTNSTNEIAQRCRDELGLVTRVTIIGHVQRGGSPSARDRVMATRMGHRAVEELLAGNTNLIVCYRNSQITTVPIDEALTMTKDLDEYMYRVATEITI